MLMSTKDTAAQAVSVEAGAVSDPALTLIERRQASDTQAFMAKMSAANIAEFAERQHKARWVRIGLAVTVALVGLVLIVIGLAGGL